LVGSLIRGDRFEQALEVLSELEGDAGNDPDLRRRITTLRGSCARKRAFNAERPGGSYSIEGVDWGEVIRWRAEAAQLVPDLCSNWVRYVYALIYAGRPEDAKRVMSDGAPPEVRGYLLSDVGQVPEILERQRQDRPFIYAREASRYLDRGLPVVPTLGKCPIPQGWGRWSDQPIPEPEYRDWFGLPWANIGLVLGRQCGVSVMDIDTNDPRLIRAICDALPRSPWQRLGRRGMAMAYRWTGLSNLQCVDDRDAPIFDYLSMRTQIMLPPSIHPQTGQLYRADNDLLAVLDDLPLLPDDIGERLKAALASAGCNVTVRSF
jgi:hypothetical protein